MRPRPMIIARAAIVLAASAGFAAPSVLSQTPPALQSDTSPYFEMSPELSLDAVVRAGSDRLDNEALALDISAKLQAEHVREDGFRWGWVLGGRLQRDGDRLGFARQQGFCETADPACPSLNGRSLAGLFTGFHAGPGLMADSRPDAIEDAYFYVKTGYYEARLGRGPGAARLEADDLPGAFRLMRADFAPVDPDGLGFVTTRNVLSGIDAKFVVQTRRLVGFRVSASFTPDRRACGVDICPVDAGTVSGPVSADIGDIWEFGASFDHLFRSSGRRWSAALTASRGSVDTSTVEMAFDDPWVVSGQVVHAYEGWSMGVAGLVSNDGIDGGDYRALSASVSREQGDWLTALETGWSQSELTGSEGVVFQLGSSRLVGRNGLIGAGLRYGHLDEFIRQDGVVFGDRRAGMSVFVESGLRF